MTKANNTHSETPVKVWDIPVRVFHWTLVGLIALSWWSAEEGGDVMQIHVYSGYAILALVLFRIVWGLIGSTSARFGDFVVGIAAVREHARSVLQRKPISYLGHTPLGGLMILALLGLLLLQAGTGLFANDDILTEGPLMHLITKDTSDLLSEIHGYVFDAILALVALHIAAVLAHLLVKHENLIRPMFTGKKLVPQTLVRPLRFASPLMALVIIAVAGAGVYWLVTQV